MKQLTILTFQYYRLLLFYNIAFTLAGAFLFAMDTKTMDANTFLIAKLTGFGGAVGLHYFSSKNTYLYFMNAGYGIKKIIANAFGIDIILYLIVVAIAGLSKSLFMG